MPARSDEPAGMAATFDDLKTPRSRSPMRKDPFAKKTSSDCSPQQQIRDQQIERRQGKQQEGQLKRRKLAEPLEKRSPPAHIHPDKPKEAHERKDDEKKNQRPSSAKAPVDAADDEPEKIQVRHEHKVDAELLDERAVTEIRQVKTQNIAHPPAFGIRLVLLHKANLAQDAPVLIRLLAKDEQCPASHKKLCSEQAQER